MQPERPVQTTLAFHASRIVIDVGVLLAMAAMSMTFVSAPGDDRSALAADALPAVLLLLPIFAVTLIPDHTKPLHPMLGWGSMVLALAALPYAFVKMLDARVLAETLGGSMGFGPVLLLLGCLVTLAGIGIGIVRDLMGWPSGGTPQRRSTYETKRKPGGGRSHGPSARNDATRVAPAASGAAESPTRVEGAGTEAPTRIVERPRPTPDAAPRPAAGEAPVRRTPPPAAQTREQPPTKPPSTRPAEPEILFPDTGAVAREAEPEDDVPDGQLDTAERADAALTESLMSMFDVDDEPDDED